MDPLRIVVRVVFAFVFMLVLVRLTGRRTIATGDLSSFVVAVIIGDMFDDLFWAEVPIAEFVVGVGTLFGLHLMMATSRYASGGREWRRALSGTTATRAGSRR